MPIKGAGKQMGLSLGFCSQGVTPGAAAPLQGLFLCVPSRGTAASRGTRTARGGWDAWPGCSASSPSCWGPSSSCSTFHSASEVTLPSPSPSPAPAGAPPASQPQPRGQDRPAPHSQPSAVGGCWLQLGLAISSCSNL